jgi:very-short-patch-repair endonuclease
MTNGSAAVIEYDIEQMADQVLSSLCPTYHERLLGQMFLLLKHGRCESPIEAMLGVAIVHWHEVAVVHTHPIIICSEAEISGYNPFQRLLVYQYKFQNYRIDWALRDPPNLYFIECDGHDFHERTKEQAAYDRQRDRLIQHTGIPILRFTGSEIYADPANCAAEVFAFIQTRRERAVG